MKNLFYPFLQPDAFWSDSGWRQYQRRCLAPSVVAPEIGSERRVRVYLIGNEELPELRYACAGILTEPEGFVVRHFSSLNEVLQVETGTETGTETGNASKEGLLLPDVLLLLESFPGEFQSDALQEFKFRFPVCPIVLIHSSWGAGATRTGFPLPVPLRVSWIDAPIWLNVQLNRLANRQFSLLSLPDSSSPAQMARYESELALEREAQDVLALKSDSQRGAWDALLLSDSSALRRLFTDWGAALSLRVRAQRLYYFEELTDSTRPTVPSAEVPSAEVPSAEVPSVEVPSSRRIVGFAPDVREEDAIRSVARLRSLRADDRIVVYLTQPSWNLVQQYYLAGADWVCSMYQ